jgi:hypothetical protein
MVENVLRIQGRGKSPMNPDASVRFDARRPRPRRVASLAEMLATSMSFWQLILT